VIKVLIVDDEQLIRHGLRQLLQLSPEFEVAGEARDGREALEAVEREVYDVVLLDVRMPQVDGLAVLDALRPRAAKPATLVLTTFDEARLLLEAVRRGASGFLSKDVSLEELHSAIRAVVAGATWFHPRLTASLRTAVVARRGLQITACAEPLTAREIDVVRLMARGLTNAEIAKALGTAEGTVKNQVAGILSKFDVRDRTLAVLRAIEHGSA
jgi:DNA-binding NarL/FixJ family response regulator